MGNSGEQRGRGRDAADSALATGTSSVAASSASGTGQTRYTSSTGKEYARLDASDMYTPGPAMGRPDRRGRDRDRDRDDEQSRPAGTTLADFLVSGKQSQKQKKKAAAASTGTVAPAGLNAAAGAGGGGGRESTSAGTGTGTGAATAAAREPESSVTDDYAFLPEASGVHLAMYSYIWLTIRPFVPSCTYEYERAARLPCNSRIVTLTHQVTVTVTLLSSSMRCNVRFL